MIELYQELPREIHYLGPEDSFSGILAEQLYVDGSGVARVAQPNFQSIVEAILVDESVIGLLPIENSTSSTVHENAEHIFSRQLTILAEARLAIHMHLLGVEGTTHDQARLVYSHTQALAQCREYLRRRKLQTVQVDSTALAADMVLAENNPEVMALGAARLANRGGITIVEMDVADHEKNETKFFIVKKRDNKWLPPVPKMARQDMRLTILAELKDKKGSLWKFLRELDIEGSANLTNIESQPVPEASDYCFWVDLETQSHNVRRLIRLARNMTDRFDVLGVYDPPRTYQS